MRIDQLEDAQRLQLLIDAVVDYAIYLVDTDGRVVSWNSGAQRLKGYQAQEIIGQDFRRFFTPEDRTAGIPAQALEIAAHAGKYEAEGWRVRKDGSRFWANAIVDPIRDEAGNLIGFAKVTRDITERRKTQEALDQARERQLQSQKLDAIAQLTGGVAHDFNNLLTVVIGNLQVAQRNLDSLTGGVETRLQRAINSAMRGARRAAKLTQRLLAFSRQQPLDPKPLDVNKFIAAEVDFLQRSLGETIEVQAIGAAGLWPVEIDSHELGAALLNLAVNARDAMPDGGSLTIETSNAFLDEDYCRANPEALPGQYVLIAVTDSGMGMTKEAMDRAFEPFFSTKAAGQGTGLGLSQVYGFVKQSGGHLKIYSELGQGTTVKIYLPRLSKPLRQMEEEGKPSEKVQGHDSKTILVVEDDEDVRLYLVQALRELNYQVLGAYDAVSALGLIERSDIRIDLLLTDVVLPGPNGRELAKQAQDRRPGLKVLFMTGYSRNAIVHHGRLDPGVEMIQKPIAQEDLSVRIRAVLDKASL
jgi:PAS domain S-box-containing protein